VNHVDLDVEEAEFSALSQAGGKEPLYLMALLSTLNTALRGIGIVPALNCDTQAASTLSDPSLRVKHRGKTEH